MLGGRRTPSWERSLFLTFCGSLAQSILAQALALNAYLPRGVANTSLSGREDEIRLRPSANRCLPMNDRARALHSALKQAANNVTQNSDAPHCVGVVAGLQHQLADLGFTPPMHPEVDLQLTRIASMLSDMHAGRQRPVSRARLSVQADDPGQPTEQFTRLSQLAVSMTQSTVMTICDGALLQGLPGISARAYLTDLLAAFPNQLRQLEIFVKPGKRDPVIAAGLNEYCADHGIVLAHRLTKELHDRVWIFDQRRAFAIGTSFGGLTDKCAFILELSREDRERYVGKLRQVREGARWAPGMSMGET